MPKIHDFDGFCSPKWSQKASISFGPERTGSDFVQRSLQDGSQTSFFMLLGAFLDAFGAYFEGFGLDFGAFKNLQKMPKTC